MKKQNRITLFAFLALIVALSIGFLVKNHVIKKSEPTIDAPSQVQTVTQSSETTEQTQPASTTSTAPQEQVSIDYNQSLLFIGDSRTVGLKEYAQIQNADFFCNVGMSVFNINKATVSIPNVGDVSIEQLLSSKKYDKILIMLGVNEVGYNHQSLINKYTELINAVKSAQPGAKIIVQANLHVTKARSDKDKVVNNTNLNSLNTQLKNLADNVTVFYIDANTYFDDAEGNLAADKTGDGVHPYAKSYQEWGQWILQQIAKI